LPDILELQAQCELAHYCGAAPSRLQTFETRHVFVSRRDNYTVDFLQFGLKCWLNVKTVMSIEY
jgi:hypothetical protein